MPELDARQLEDLGDFLCNRLPMEQHWGPPWQMAGSRLIEDSRLAKGGDLFVARCGSQFDSHAHVRDLLHHGVFAVVDQAELALPGTLLVHNTSSWLARAVETMAGESSSALDVYGITGTNGKTSTAWILHHILLSSDSCTGLCGTTGARMGNSEQTFSALTTPSAAELSRFCQGLANNGATTLVMEVSSHAIRQHRVTGLEFRATAFLNLSPEHLDYHGNMAAYFDCKREFMSRVDPTVRVVLRLDDWGKKLAARLGTACITAGTDPKDCWCLQEAETSGWSQRLKILGPEGLEEYLLPLAGIHNAWNALAAIVLARETQKSVDEIQKALRQLPAIPGRLERHQRKGKAMVVIDYAHTPDGYTQCFKSLKAVRRGRLHCVFGCGGDRDRSQRAAMVHIASQYADTLTLCLDNPRNENPEQIFCDMREGLGGTTDWRRIDDRGAAIRTVIAEAAEEDLVLLLGKGHERYQIIGDTRIPFDETAVVQAAFDG